MEENLNDNNLIKIDELNKNIYEQITIKEELEIKINNLQNKINDLTNKLKINEQKNYNEISNYKNIISEKVIIIQELEIVINKIKHSNLLNDNIKN